MNELGRVNVGIIGWLGKLGIELPKLAKLAKDLLAKQPTPYQKS
jgi:hypothetical protein